MSSTKWKQRKTVVGKIKIRILKFVGIAVLGMGCNDKESVQSKNLISDSQLLAERININEFYQDSSPKKLSEAEIVKTIESESIFYNRKSFSKNKTHFCNVSRLSKKCMG